jgi:hypothetical protein
LKLYPGPPEHFYVRPSLLICSWRDDFGEMISEMRSYLSKCVTTVTLGLLFSHSCCIAFATYYQRIFPLADLLVRQLYKLSRDDPLRTSYLSRQATTTEPILRRPHSCTYFPPQAQASLSFNSIPQFNFVSVYKLLHSRVVRLTLLPTITKIASPPFKPPASILPLKPIGFVPFPGF